MTETGLYFPFLYSHCLVLISRIHQPPKMNFPFFSSFSGNELSCKVICTSCIICGRSSYYSISFIIIELIIFSISSSFGPERLYIFRDLSVFLGCPFYWYIFVVTLYDLLHFCFYYKISFLILFTWDHSHFFLDEPA